MARLARLVVIATVVGIVLAAPAAAADSPPDELQASALRLVAKQANAAIEDLEVVGFAAAAYPLQGMAVFRFKVLDTREKGLIYPVSLDRTGREIDDGDVERAEVAARRARYGRLDPALSDRLARTNERERLNVVVWLREPDARLPARLEIGDRQYTTQQVQAFLRDVDAERASAVRQLTGPLVERLRRLDGTASPHAHSPAVHARVTAAGIKEEIAAWPDVDRVYLGLINDPELDVATAFIGARNVHLRLAPPTSGGGYVHGTRGSGVTQGLVEAKGNNVASHTSLGAIWTDPAYACGSASRTHSTALAGILLSNHGVWTGVAPDAGLVATGSCSGDSRELQDRAAQAVTNGAQALNLSFGADTDRLPTEQDRFFDDLVANRLRQVVKSAGGLRPCADNGGTSESKNTNNVTSPGLGYNVLAVGAFNAADATGMSPCSSGGNPVSTNGDRQKPELAAPGVDIETADLNGGFTKLTGGTSFSAPMVTGTLGLLLQRAPVLGSYPEVLRAILMASATHNREGVSDLSDFDGVGGVNADAADQVAGRVGNRSWGRADLPCTPGEREVAFAPVPAGKRVRIAAAWNSSTSHRTSLAFKPWFASNTSGGVIHTPNGTWFSTSLPESDWPHLPDADVDLLVRGGWDFRILKLSARFDNNYEILDFVVPEPGQFAIHMAPMRCADRLTVPVGWALWTN